MNESAHKLSADHTFTFKAIDPVNIANPQTFTITNNGKEMLRLAGNGDIYVRGELMETNRDVVEGLKRMLNPTPASNQLAKKLQDDYIKQIDDEIATRYFGQSLDTLSFSRITLPDWEPCDFPAVKVSTPVPLGVIVDSERRIEAVCYDGGANCSVCNLHNKYQTAPYTCYGCSH